jgi:hypothetical protein
MADLINRVRFLVRDPVGLEQVFEDDEIQDALDRRRTHADEACLYYRPSTSVSGTTEYHDYFAGRGDWEDTVILKGSGGALLTPDSEDLLNGRWGFTASQLPPVYISGDFYDVYGTAAALGLVAQNKAGQDLESFSTDGQSFKWAKRESWASLVTEYRRLAIQPGKRPSWHGSDW